MNLSDSVRFGLGRGWGAIALLLAMALFPTAASAQELPPCQPPATDEYLLLVVSETAAQREAVQSLVPSGTTIAVCQYFADPVVRVGGFTNPETAGAWAEYLSGEVSGIQAFVARPAVATSTADANATTNTRFNPQPLGLGYAVLVDYFNYPEVALDVQATLGQPVGVATYHQQPYLLALYTADLQVASLVLKQLSDRDFAALLVDSRQVILLTSTVAPNLAPADSE